LLKGPSFSAKPLRLAVDNYIQSSPKDSGSFGLREGQAGERETRRPLSARRELVVSAGALWLLAGCYDMWSILELGPEALDG